MTTAPKRESYDVVVIGAGPAGLAALPRLMERVGRRSDASGRIEQEVDDFASVMADTLARRATSRSGPTARTSP